MRAKRSSNRAVLLAALLCCSSAAWAERLSLSAALDAAKLYDSRYQAALRDFEASQELGVQGKAALGPEVSLAASGAQNQLGQTVGASSRTINYQSTSLVVQLRQPIYSAELRARSREGEARSRQGAAGLAEQKAQLLLRLMEAYANILLADELLATASAESESLDERLRAARRLRARGEGTVTEELEASSRLAIASARFLEARGERQDAIERLQMMVGPSISIEPKSLDGQFKPVHLDPVMVGEWEALSLAHNPSIEVRRHALQAAREVLDRIGAARQPRIDLLVSVSRGDSDSINTVNQSSLQKSVGVQLNMPLFDNGRSDSQVRQAVAAAGTAQAQLDYTRDSVLAELRQNYRALINLKQKMKAYAHALDSAVMQIEATQKSVKGGIRVALDVLNAQTQRFSIQQELTKARFDYFKAWFRLRAAAGILDEPDIAMIDQQLK